MKSQRTAKRLQKSFSSTQHSPEILESIRSRAYELFLLRGQEHGHDIEDWLQAENEITRPKAKTTAA